MSEAVSQSGQSVFRVAIRDAHLEFLVDGDGDWFATLNGVVTRSGHAAVREGLPIDIRFGAYEPEVWGLHVGPKAASATIKMDAAGIARLKSLIAQCRPQGPSLMVEATVLGEPDARASGPGHFWRRCQAAAQLSNTAAPRPEGPKQPDFDADLRIAVPADGLNTFEDGGRFRMSGPVIQSRRDKLPPGLSVSIRFEPGAGRQVSVSEDQLAITWPLTELDARGVLELMERVKPGGVLVDLDIGQVRGDPEPRPWCITDLTIIAACISPREKSPGDRARPT